MVAMPWQGVSLQSLDASDQESLRNAPQTCGTAVRFHTASQLPPALARASHWQSTPAYSAKGWNPQLKTLPNVQGEPEERRKPKHTL